MNFNFSLICDGCDVQTNVRLGMSNREIQPLRFSCQDCGAPIDINFIIGGPTSVDGAKYLQHKGMFDPDVNFVDLHLDFPVSFEKYVPGNTPFMQAWSRIDHESMSLHQARLNYLNSNEEHYKSFTTCLKHYSRRKFTPFKLMLERVFSIKTKSDNPQDLNAALYSLIANMMAPFTLPGQNAESVQNFERTLFSSANIASISSFFDELSEAGFLRNIQQDCLEIYPRIWAAQLVFRPALFLDYDKYYDKKLTALRVSTSDFDSYKDLFKDMSEILSRQLTLVAEINNVQKRGDHNNFKEVKNKTGKSINPRSLNEFADVDFGRKLSFIDDSWFVFQEDAVANYIRNAVAHYRAEYDDISQIVTCFPKKEGLAQEAKEEMYFIEFIRRTLLLYRELHRLHQVVKCIYYYRFLIQKKDFCPL